MQRRWGYRHRIPPTVHREGIQKKKKRLEHGGGSSVQKLDDPLERLFDHSPWGRRQSNALPEALGEKEQLVIFKDKEVLELPETLEGPSQPSIPAEDDESFDFFNLELDYDPSFLEISPPIFEDSSPPAKDSSPPITPQHRVTNFMAKRLIRVLETEQGMRLFDEFIKLLGITEESALTQTPELYRGAEKTHSN